MPSSSRPARPESPSGMAPVDRVPLLDIGRENTPLEPEMLAAITHVVRSGRFVLGPEVQQLEQRVSRLCDAKHAVGCASGSDALLLALMAIGIKAGDEVIVPSFTFFATASAVWRLGATPIFVDIDPITYNISPAAVREAITDKTRAIIPVHLFGLPADMKSLLEIGEEHDIRIVEDAAQAIGAAVNGQPVGAIGDIGCFSFYPTKNLGGFGDGGMLTSNSDELSDQLALLRGHGMRPRYYHETVGINSRLDTLQAVVLNIKLPHLQAWSDARAENAKMYDELFKAEGVEQIILPPQPDSSVKPVWNQYTVRISEGRDELRQWLASHNIGTEIYYPVPLHRQACFENVEQRFDLPETERASQEVLSLPIFPTMTLAEQETVVMRVCEFMESRNATGRKAA